ncbi:MAG: glycosyltransferase family 39 protein [archaeon]
MEEFPSKSAVLDKFLEFLNKNTSLIILIILVATFLLRLKYMNINAGVWWDEADYLRLAKHYAFGLQDIAATYRERAMTMVWGLMYKLGATDWTIRFIEQLISVAAVYFVYLLGKEFYGKNVGLIAASFLAVIWVHMFWATRISMGLHGMFLWLVAAYLFWKGYVKNGKWWYVALAAMIIAFGTYAYSAIGLSLFLFLGFILITERFKFLRNKRAWIAFFAALLIIIPFMIYNQVNFGHVYPRFGQNIQHEWSNLGQGTLEKWETGSVSNFFVYSSNLPSYLTWPLFALLMVGLISVFGNVLFGFDLLIKGKGDKIKRDLYIFLWAFIVLLMFSIVYTTTHFELDPRFLFPMYPAVSIIAAVGLLKIYSYLKKYNKILAFVAVATIFSFAIYSNITVADDAINAKKDTYLGEKEAGLWMRENSKPEDYIITCNQEVVFGYYTERNMGSFGANVTEADRMISELNPKYIVLDIYHPDCAFNLQQESSYKLEPIYVAFMDADKKQPAVIVYTVLGKREAPEE